MMKKTLTLISCLLAVVQGFSFNKEQFKQQPQPLAFEENKGQVTDQHNVARADIQYALKTPGMSVFIGNGALHYQFYKTIKSEKAELPAGKQLPKGVTLPNKNTIVTYRLDVQLAGANSYAQAVTENVVGEATHYYTNAAIKDGVAANSFQKVTYKDVYPGIDWVLYTQDNSLKYDFVVHAGAHLADIKLVYGGATYLNYQDDGSIQAITPYGTITEQAPKTYQAADNKAIASQFVLQNNTVSFSMQDAYKGALVIDPGVAWATYYGSGNEGTVNGAANIACDPSGNVYMAGSTNSPSNIATAGSFEDTLINGGPYYFAANGYLVKFDSTGKRKWATYYGGPDANAMFFVTLSGAIACDNAYHIYIGGMTSTAIGIATTGTYQPAINSTASALYGAPVDGYIAQFDTAGVRKWGSYFGGEGDDLVYGITAGLDNTVYLYGNTNSKTHIASAGAHQDTLGKETTKHIANVGNRASAFVAKFNGTGTLAWSTYYGDGNNPAIYSAACDAANNIYIGGTTNTDGGTNNIAYTTTGAFQTANGGVANGTFDGFLAKLNSNGVRQWGTYFHSTVTSTTDGDDNITGVACDKQGHVYVGGFTQNLVGIATAGSFHSSPIQSAFINGRGNVFMAQFTSAGTRNWCTYYGSGTSAQVAVDGSGVVYLAGNTDYTDSIGVGLSSHVIATESVHQGKLIGAGNAFVTQFDSTGNRHWGTYYGGGGGTGGETTTGLTCDTRGNVYLSGFTASKKNIATPGSFRDTLDLSVPALLIDAANAYLVRFAPLDITVKNTLTDTVCAGTVPYTVTLQNNGRLNEDTIKVTTVITNNGTGVPTTLTATTTQTLQGGGSTVFTVGNMTLDSNTSYTIQTYIRHITDDSSFVNDTVTKTIYVKNCPPQSVAKVTIDKHVAIFPNPTTGVVQLAYYGISKKAIEITVMNNVGQQLFYTAYTGTNGNFTTSVDLSRYSKGIYYIRTNVDDEVIVNKVVLQ